MAEGERATGTPNTIYDLSSVLFHALEGGASYDTFIEDAEREGDQELVDFFRQVRDEDSNRADRAQQLLAERTHTGMGMTSGAAPGMEPSGALAGTEPITEDVPPGDIRGGTATAGRMPEEDLVPPGEEIPPDVPRTGEVPPMTEERPLGAEEPPLGTEGTMPPREEMPPRTEEAPPRMEGAPPGMEERRRQERDEDKGLIDRAIDKISGRDEEERERPDRRS